MPSPESIPQQEAFRAGRAADRTSASEYGRSRVGTSSHAPACQNQKLNATPPLTPIQEREGRWSARRKLSVR